MADDPLPIKTIGTTFAVVEALARHDRASLDTLVSAVDASKSTVYKHLRTLEELGYVAHTPGGYRLTTDLAALAGRVDPSTDGWRAEVRDELSGLANTTGDVAGLVRLEGHFLIQLEQERGDTSRQRGFAFQTTPQPHASAGGKAILAALGRERVEAVVEDTGLPALTGETITDETALFEELDRVRDRGFAVEREEQAPGVSGVAAAAEWEGGRPPGAIYVVGPTARMSAARLDEDLPEIVRSVVERLEPIGDADGPGREGLAIPKR